MQLRTIMRKIHIKITMGTSHVTDHRVCPLGCKRACENLVWEKENIYYSYITGWSMRVIKLVIYAGWADGGRSSGSCSSLCLLNPSGPGQSLLLTPWSSSSSHPPLPILFLDSSPPSKTQHLSGSNKTSLFVHTHLCVCWVTPPFHDGCDR